MTRRLWIAGVLIFAPAALWAQKERADIRAGNRAYYEGKYPEAEVGYKRAIEKNISSYEANFNLAGALYKQGRYDDAAATYQKLAQDGTDTERQASTYYNIGNTYVKQRKLDEAIEAYKNALRLTPDDKEAKFNLAYAKKLKQDEDKKNDQNQNQDQNQDRNQNGGGGGNDDRNRDKNQDQNKNNDKNRNNNDPDKNNDKNNDRNGDQNEDKPDGGQSPQQQPSASRDESERLLRAIQASEDKTKKKVDAEKAQAVGARGGKQW